MTNTPASITVVTPPAIEPITLVEAKAHCRIDDTDSDTLIMSLIVVAREYAENYTRRALITRTLDVAFDRFTGVMEMPQAPMQSVTSIKYLDSAGDEQTLDSGVYRTDSARDPGRIARGYEQGWPDVYGVLSPITIRIVSGFGDATTDIPQTIRQAMLLLVSHWYENRESTQTVGNIKTIPMGIDALLIPHIVHYF